MWLCYAVGGILLEYLFWLITVNLWWNISLLMQMASSWITPPLATWHSRSSEWFDEDANVVNHMISPSQSPDLKLIERLWDILDHRVRQRSLPVTLKSQLSEYSLKEWCSLSQYSSRDLNNLHKGALKLFWQFAVVQCLTKKLRLCVHYLHWVSTRIFLPWEWVIVKYGLDVCLIINYTLSMYDKFILH